MFVLAEAADDCRKNWRGREDQGGVTGSRVTDADGEQRLVYGYRRDAVKEHRQQMLAFNFEALLREKENCRHAKRSDQKTRSAERQRQKIFQRKFGDGVVRSPDQRRQKQPQVCNAERRGCLLWCFIQEG